MEGAHTVPAARTSRRDAGYHPAMLPFNHQKMADWRGWA